MAHPLAGKQLTLQCQCGWSDTMPATAGGVTIECPRCGRNLRVPNAGPVSSESDADIATVERLTGRKFVEAPPLAPLMRLPLFALPPLALVSLAFWKNYWPAGAVWPLIAVFWWLGLWIAALGARSPEPLR